MSLFDNSLSLILNESHLPTNLECFMISTYDKQLTSLSIRLIVVVHRFIVAVYRFIEVIYRFIEVIYRFIVGVNRLIGLVQG